MKDEQIQELSTVPTPEAPVEQQPIEPSPAVVPSDMTQVVLKSAVKFQGVRYTAGETLVLTSDEAAMLIASGVVV
jgi:hypothetical protein